MIQTKLAVVAGPGWPDKFGDELRKWFEQKKSKKIKALSLFSGGGGLDIAFHDRCTTPCPRVTVPKD
jgi:DNA (cytosine-5)-methyltransferase 1